MRVKTARLTVLACAMAAVAAAAGAQEAPSFAVRGFGTLGAVHSSEKNADFVHGFFEPNGAGFTHKWALGVDSKVGVQADAAVTDKLSAVLQVVSLHRYDNTYTPKVEWANVKYQLTPDFDVRLGRTVTMPFMVSDARLVGYANVWVRPPQEVYGLIPITNKDGIDSTYRMHLGEVTNSVHVSYGGTELKLPGAGSVRAKRYFDVSNTAEYGGFTARVSYSTGRVDLRTPTLDTLVGAYAGFGAALAGVGATAQAAQAQAVAERYRFENAPISVVSAGLSYDRDRWLLMGEWAKFNGHSILADSSAWYATAGYRVGTLTPYATLARLSAERPSDPGVSAAGLPAPLAATALALNTGLNTATDAAAFAQRSISAGLRWDAFKNGAVKVQYDRIKLDPWSSGRLGNVQPNFRPGGTVNVFSVAVDFVF